MQKINHKRRKNTFRNNYLFLGALLLGLGFAGFYLKNKISFYYQMHWGTAPHRRLTNSAFENQRINRIITEHNDKIFGFDISHYQRQNDIRWDSLRMVNGDIQLDFVVMRATMGTQKKDENFEAFWAAAKANNLTRGAYHFYRADEDPVLQAQHFLKNVKLEAGDLRPVLDIEKLPKKKSKRQLKKDLKTWLRIIEERYGQKPIIYTYYHYYKDYLRGDFEDYPLWLANYNNVSVPSAEDSWKMWQFTENGIVRGINTKVDLNIFNGNIWSFRALTINQN